MQLPIPVETVLQNRYRILRVLGQGGFGRTYLAEDKGRFNEYCALKEYIPNQSSDYALDKSRELFQREATILYQIKHRQVPEFRATFEENQRLFLVQDYVHGKTYRHLLDERISRNMAFSEPEVLWLIQNLLPVLAHVHSKGIIHRDITPDNVILRQDDHLPVLIDFGVVKEIATRFHSPDSTSQPTTVGKPGYAPSEQVQTGRAYPSSDLYSLAVTAVVLLTGHEPQDLFDDTMLTWHWQQWVHISPSVTQILNRMLSYRPGDRYQSVAELADALREMDNTTNGSPFSQGGAQPSQVRSEPHRPAAATSDIRTVAVGRRPESPSSSTSQSTQAAYSRDPRGQRASAPTAPSQDDPPSIWDNPLSIIIIGIGLAVVTGIGSWAVVNAILSSPQEPEPEPPPIVEPEPEPEPEPELEPPSEPVEYSQELSPTVGEPLQVDGSLRSHETINYIVSGTQAQTLAAVLENEGVLMTVLAPNGDSARGRSRRVQSWEDTLDFTGDYTIQLKTVAGIDESEYSLVLELNDSESEPEPEPEPEPPPEPTVEVERLSFPEGSEGVIVTARTNASTIRRYLVNAQASQVLSAELVEGPVTLNIRYPDGELVEDASRVVFWEAQLPESGDYQIDVVSADTARFRLEVRVSDLAE